MIKTIVLSMCLAISALSLSARAQQQDKGKSTYSNGPVTLVSYIHVEYGHFEDYMAWVTSTWVPTMEAEKKAGLIIEDQHEHLGQSIAYARSTGVVPPWSK